MDPSKTLLSARWAALCHRLALKNPSGVFNALWSRYTAPGRHYHGMAHIADCLHELDAVRSLCDNCDAIEAAIWFHDYIYDPARIDNEELSADEAAAALTQMQAPQPLINTIRDLILATRHENTAPRSKDARLMVDIDLVPLAAPPSIFDANGQAIRAEYATLGDEAYFQGRAAILQKFLSRPRIYFTETFRHKYEQQARSNLQRTLAATA